MGFLMALLGTGITARPTTSLAPNQCPPEHPFVYRSGEYCCKYDKEGGDGSVDGWRCDGSKISIDSSCCYEGKWVRCPIWPNGKCDNHGGMCKKFSLACTLLESKMN